ncbi:MAG: PqiC family protein, partial [Desulfobacterales bacterium]
MTYRVAYVGLVMLAVSVILLNGCAGSSKPSEFYLLHSLPASQDTGLTASESRSPSVLIGPVTLPAYLDRSQIVTLAGNHKLVVNEFTRWAEPLQDNFYRVLVENLSMLLNTPKVYTFDRHGSTSADFQIVINVTRFDTTAGKDAYLTAFWSVVSKEDRVHLMERKSV